MKTLSYITIAVDPLSSPHTQTILFRWTQATRKGGKCQCKTFPWVWETAHLTVNPKYQEERGKSQAGGPEDIVVARPITGGKSRGSCCCVRSHWDLWRKEAEVCIWRAKAGRMRGEWRIWTSSTSTRCDPSLLYYFHFSPRTNMSQHKGLKDRNTEVWKLEAKQY